MIKKISLLLTVCLVVLVMSTTVFAGEITITRDASDQTLITVTGKNFTAGDQVGVIALKPDVTLTTINESDPIQSIDYIDQAEADQNGGFEFTYKSSGEPGTYNVYYTGNTADPVIYSIVISDDQKGSISGKITSKGNNTEISITAQKDGQDVKTVNAAGDGSFIIEDLDAGTYSVVITKEGYLKLTITGITVSEEQDSAVGEKALLAGDVDGNDKINSSDLSPLLTAFNSVSGGAKFNANMDFNDDDKINSTDLSFLLANFNKTTASY